MGSRSRNGQVSVLPFDPLRYAQRAVGVAKRVLKRNRRKYLARVTQLHMALAERRRRGERIRGKEAGRGDRPCGS